MRREDFISHLVSCDCFSKPEYETEENELYANCINGLICNVPKDEIIENLTVIKSCFDLKIDPPIVLESEYHVFMNTINHIKEQSKQAKPPQKEE